MCPRQTHLDAGNDRIFIAGLFSAVYNDFSPGQGLEGEVLQLGDPDSCGILNHSFQFFQQHLLKNPVADINSPTRQSDLIPTGFQ